jgi:DNA-binding ferritin-like protein
LADTFTLYVKTKNFHWHMSGPHFRDYHLLLDEHADQIFAMTDPIAERVRKLGQDTIHSTGQIARLQRISDNDAGYVEPSDMLAELREDNKTLAARLREAHNVCEQYRDVATTSLIEIGRGVERGLAAAHEVRVLGSGRLHDSGPRYIEDGGGDARPSDSIMRGSRQRAPGPRAGTSVQCTATMRHTAP